MRENIINKITLTLQDMDLITLKALLNVITQNNKKSNKCSTFYPCNCLSSQNKDIREVNSMENNNKELIEKIINLLNAKSSETSALNVIYELLIRL